MTDERWRPGEVLNDEAQNKRCVLVGYKDQKMGENPKAADNARNRHYTDDPHEPLVNVVYLPDEGEMRVPSKPYAVPEARLSRFKTEEATDFQGSPLDELQAQTIASTIIEVGAEGITRDMLDNIAGEGTGQRAWELVQMATDFAEGTHEH